MGDFTEQDRERAQKTITLLESHIKQSDERHRETKTILEDHEHRIRKNESIVARVAVLSSFVGASITAAATAAIKKIGG